MNNRICELRKHLALTQTAFGDKIGLSRDAIASYERGNAKPTAVALKCISTVFNVSLIWLETGEGEMFAGKSAEDIAMENAIRTASESPAIRALLTAYSRLNDQNRAVFEKFVEDYVSEYEAQSAAESAAKDEAVFDAPLKVTYVRNYGAAFLDGRVEAKYAAAKEQKELQSESEELQSESEDPPFPLTEDFSYEPFLNKPPDPKILR